MKVFVTGATGYIGKAVCKKLKDEGHEVIGLTHNPDHRRILEELGAQPVVADIKSTEQWKNYLGEVDGAIHLAQDHEDQAGADNAAVDAIIEGFAGTPKRFVYTSSVWVLGNTGPEEAAESTPTNPIPAMEWRADLEQRLITAERTKEVHVCIVRPAIVYGEGGGIPAILSRMAYEQDEARYIGNGDNIWSMVEINDLAELYALALEKGYSGEIYHAADNQAYTFRELAEAASEGAGRDGKARTWDKGEARKELGPLADALVLNQNISGAKAGKFLGWETRAPYNAIEDLKLGSYAVRS
jgi:nucleoside-diphosphate-sugar epimerase